jgi:hypothetical protein
MPSEVFGRESFVFDPQVLTGSDAGQQPGQGQPQLVQARRRRRSAQFTRLPSLGAVDAVEDDVRYRGEAADPHQRSHAPAGYHGDSCSRSPHVVQDLPGSCHRARVVGMR